MRHARGLCCRWLLVVDEHELQHSRRLIQRAGRAVVKAVERRRVVPHHVRIVSRVEQRGVHHRDAAARPSEGVRRHLVHPGELRPVVRGLRRIAFEPAWTARAITRAPRAIRVGGVRGSPDESRERFAVLLGVFVQRCARVEHIAEHEAEGVECLARVDASAATSTSALIVRVCKA